MWGVPVSGVVRVPAHVSDGKGSAVAAAPPFFCARVVPVWVAAGSPYRGTRRLEHRRLDTRRLETRLRCDLQRRQRREWGIGSGGNGDAVEGTSARPWLTRATEECARFWSSSVAPNGQAFTAMSRNRW